MLFNLVIQNLIIHILIQYFNYVNVLVFRTCILDGGKRCYHTKIKYKEFNHPKIETNINKLTHHYI